MAVVLITVDCLRADHLGCYGYDRPTTPNIDAFASDNTRYEHAYANSPGTRWAFQVLHTGLPTISIQGLGIPEDSQPLAERFKENEYSTGGFAVNGFVSREYNYDRGFDTYYSITDSSDSYSFPKRLGLEIDRLIGNSYIRKNVFVPLNNFVQQTRSENNQYRPQHSDADTVDSAIEFINQNQGEEYFLWVHLMDAHTPYGYWPAHLKEIRGDTNTPHSIRPGKEGKVASGRKPAPEVIDSYDAAIRSADEQIGKILESISDEATTIITGDHGEEFGHYSDFHEASLYSSMTQIPLIIRTQNIEPGVTQTPVQHLDIPPTVLYSAGITPPKEWPGAPLQVVDRDQNYPIYFCLSRDEIGVRVGEWKLITADGVAELYNVPPSGQESTPVDNPEQLKRLEELVNTYLAETGTLMGGRSSLEDDELSDEIKDNLEDLGYL